MRTFYFTRILKVEEKYAVRMGDEMANEAVAHKMLLRRLNENKIDGTNVELLESKLVSTGRSTVCK